MSGAIFGLGLICMLMIASFLKILITAVSSLINNTVVVFPNHTHVKKVGHNSEFTFGIY